MTHAYLQGRSPALPHVLELPSGQTLVLRQWLRVLPNQRYVAEAQWQEETVLAKFYVGTKALRHYTRELKGVQSLLQQQLMTPRLLDAQVHDGWGAWLLFEYLDESISLGERWQHCSAQKQLSPEQNEVLGQALGCIGRMHKHGLWQSDLHLDNFLCQNGQLYIIDGGGLEQQRAGKPVDRETALNNLAVFFAQLPSTLEAYLEELLVHYVLENSEHALPLEQLQGKIADVRAWRLKDYLNKTARDCTLFSVQKTCKAVQAVTRNQLERVGELIENPDHFIEQGHLYKTGGAATVARVEHQGNIWIIKRYNIKNILHWFRRCWRPSRAWHSWQAGHRLEMLGIANALPVAVKEKRIFGLRHKAWLISTYCGEENLITRFSPYIDTAEVPQTDLHALQDLLHDMIRAKISHGDLKGDNIFCHNGRCLLIDLDAVRQHRSHSSFARAFARDRARLLRNWPRNSPLYQLLDQRLPQVD